MKKVILTLFVLLSIGIFANDEIISELKGLNAEYENLVKEEEARFQKKKNFLKEQQLKMLNWLN